MMLVTAGASSAMLGGFESAVVGAIVGVCTLVTVNTLPLVDRIVTSELQIDVPEKVAVREL